MERSIHECDVLVIGSGGAGCRAAIEAKKHDLNVTIVSKGLSFKSGCTMLAEGGYNAAFAYVDVEDTGVDREIDVANQSCDRGVEIIYVGCINIQIAS